MAVKIIGLAGPAGSGKSTAAAYLVAKYGATRYSLARDLKEICRRAFDLTEAQVYGSQEDKERVDPHYGVSPRWLMQRIGTEGVRAVLGQDFWPRNLLDRIARERPRLAVIDDVRFENEARLIRESFAPAGVVWRLHPPPDLRVSDDPGTHVTETEWRTLVADTDIEPALLGPEQLHACLRTVCAAHGIRPEVAL